MGDIKKQTGSNKIRGYLHDFGKLFIDIAKLAFGSLVLGTIIRWDIPHTTTFILGIIFSAVVATVGIILARTYEEK
jgi:site-specific recombinase